MRCVRGSGLRGGGGLDDLTNRLLEKLRADGDEATSRANRELEAKRSEAEELKRRLGEVSAKLSNEFKEKEWVLVRHALDLNILMGLVNQTTCTCLRAFLKSFERVCVQIRSRRIQFRIPVTYAHDPHGP
jgi:broad specificity phosphatase PhoE